MKISLVGLAFAILGAGITVGIIAWEPWDDDGMGDAVTHTLNGTVAIRQQTSITYSLGDTCQGEGPFSNIGFGTQVLIKDSEGALLETGALDRGTVTFVTRPFRSFSVLGDREPEFVPGNVRCEFSFQIPGVADADFYSIEVGREAPLTLSLRELESKGWTLIIELGD